VDDRPRVLGVPIDPVDLDGLLDRVAVLVDGGRAATVCYVNAHVLDVSTRDPGLVHFLRTADLCYCDGRGVVLGARLLGHHLPGRLTGADWIHDLAARSIDEGWRLAWVGGEPGVTADAARQLEARHSGLDIVHTDHGFRLAPDLAVLNSARPDIVLVGMGTPLQERWVRWYRAGIEAPVVWCVGATADFVSGRLRRGPDWLSRDHEWMARLVVEPRRLWRRYLVGNPRFLLRVLDQRLQDGSR